MPNRRTDRVMSDRQAAEVAKKAGKFKGPTPSSVKGIRVRSGKIVVSSKGKVRIEASRPSHR